MATIWMHGPLSQMFQTYMLAAEWLMENVGQYEVQRLAQRFAITESETLFKKWNKALADYEAALVGQPFTSTNKLEIRCFDAPLWKCYYCINTHDMSPDADNGAEVLIVVDDDTIAVQLKLIL